MFSSLWLRHTSNKWDGIPNKTSRILWVVPLSDPEGDYHLVAKGRLSIGQLSWQYLRWSSVSLSQWSSGSVCSAILSLRFDYDNRRLFVLQRDSEGESKRTQFVQQHVSRLEEGSYVNSVYDASVLTTTCILSSCDEKRVEVAWNNAFWKIFSAHRHENVKPFQYCCSCLPVSILLPMKKLLFWKKMMCSGNLIPCRLAEC